MNLDATYSAIQQLTSSRGKTNPETYLLPTSAVSGQACAPSQFLCTSRAAMMVTRATNEHHVDHKNLVDLFSVLRAYRELLDKRDGCCLLLFPTLWQTPAGPPSFPWLHVPEYLVEQSNRHDIEGSGEEERHVIDARREYHPSDDRGGAVREPPYQ